MERKHATFGIGGGEDGNRVSVNNIGPQSI